MVYTWYMRNKKKEPKLFTTFIKLYIYIYICSTKTATFVPAYDMVREGASFSWLMGMCTTSCVHSLYVYMYMHNEKRWLLTNLVYTVCVCVILYICLLSLSLAYDAHTQMWETKSTYRWPHRRAAPLKSFNTTTCVWFSVCLVCPLKIELFFVCVCVCVFHPSLFTGQDFIPWLPKLFCFGLRDRCLTHVHTPLKIPDFLVTTTQTKNPTFRNKYGVQCAAF